MGIVCQHLSKIYPSSTGPVTALKNVTFRVGVQEFVCIVGPSGCGKSTLLKLIAGLIEPTSGNIHFETDQVEKRPRSAMVFQEHGLFPWMTVLDNVAFVWEVRGMGRHERRERARAFIEQVGLAAFACSYPHELSVGMRQRVGIARAFAADPHILLMDEPFGSLDTQTKLVLQQELLRIWKDHQTMVLYVTHDVEEAVLLGDRVLVMTGRPGQILAEIAIPLGRPRQLLGPDRRDVKETKWHIWTMLEEEVRQSLSLSR
jgi:NitT/TauT family transport system ATP-binding protein